MLRVSKKGITIPEGCVMVSTFRGAVVHDYVYYIVLHTPPFVSG